MMEGKNMSEGKMEGYGCMCDGGGCGCMHHKIIPMLVVVFGALFLFEAYGSVNPDTVAIVWPILVILAGLTKLFRGMCKCC